MHIPPYYKKPSWQRFFVGAFFGALLGYFVVIFMYNTMYQQLLEDHARIQAELKDAEKKIVALEEDNANLDEKTKKAMTVEKIKMSIQNAKQLKLDSLITHQLEELVKEEIDHIIGMEVSLVSASDDLIISSIENKQFIVDDFSYQFTIRTLTITDTITITARAKISN